MSLDTLSASRGRVDEPYVVRASSTGGSATGWTLSSSPAWLDVSAEGVVSGTPPVGTTAFSYVLTCRDASGRTAEVRVEVAVAPPLNAIALSFAKTSYGFHTGKAGAVTPTVTGGSGQQAWKFVAKPPASLSIDPATGRIASAATSSVVAPVAVEVEVADATGSATAGFTYSVQAPLTLAYGNQLLYIGQAYGASPAGTALPGSTYAASDTRLRSNYYGLSVDPATGAFGGTPSRIQTGRSTTVTVTEPDGAAFTSASFVYVIQPRVASTTLQGGAQAYGPVASIPAALAFEGDASGVSVPAGGSVSILYDGAYDVTSFAVGTGPTGSSFRIEYRGSDGAWRTAGNVNFGANTSGSAIPNALNLVSVTGVRATNTGSGTGQLDRILAGNVN